MRIELFGDFLLLERLPTSGTAEIAVAVRLGDRSGRTFVVKRPPLGERASGAAAQAIAHEAEVLGAVRAPGIVALEAAGEIAGLPYVALEHVRGVPLDELLAARGALPSSAVRTVAHGLADALSRLHAAGWVHGDVAPSNVLVDDAGEVRLIDFGLATRIGAPRDRVAGKPGYVAPEAVRQVEAHAAEDVYGWGVVVAESALGARLFEEHDLAEAASRADAPPEVARVGADAQHVAAALRRDPAVRPSAQELAARFGANGNDSAELALLVHETAQAADVRARRSASTARAASAPPALTPTAPMIVRATITDVPVVPELEHLSERAPIAVRSTPVRRRTLPIVLLALAALVAGGFVGRVTLRARPASVSFGQLGRRARLELDGRAITPPADGSDLPIAPGRHTLTLITGKGDRRETVFQARPGEHVLFLSLARPATSADEDRTP